jgi:hypothetical protein
MVVRCDIVVRWIGMGFEWDCVNGLLGNDLVILDGRVAFYFFFFFFRDDDVVWRAWRLLSTRDIRWDTVYSETDIGAIGEGLMCGFDDDTSYTRHAFAPSEILPLVVF